MLSNNHLFYDNGARFSTAYRVKVKLVRSCSQTRYRNFRIAGYVLGACLTVYSVKYVVLPVAATVVPVEAGGTGELIGQCYIGGRASSFGAVIFRGSKGEAKGKQQGEEKKVLSHVNLVLECDEFGATGRWGDCRAYRSCSARGRVSAFF